MKNKNVIITGGAGYIGSNILISLLKKGYKPIVIDNLSNGSLSNIRAVQKYFKKEILFYKKDITIRKDVDKVFRSFKNIYAVFHLASLKSISASMKQPGYYFNNNINGTLNIISAMMQYNCNRLIFSSSASVYDSSYRKPFRENNRLSYKNPYSDSKIIIENILDNYSKVSNSLKVCILRYFNPAGFDKYGILKNYSSKKDSNLFENIGKVIKKKQKILQIYKNKNPNYFVFPVRDYIHISDLSEANVQVLDNMDKFSCEILNLGTGVGYTVEDIVKIYKDRYKIIIPKNISKARIGDEDYSVASIKKIKKLLGWKPRYDIRDICEDYT